MNMIIPNFIKEFIKNCIDIKGRVQGAKQKKYMTTEISQWLSENNLNPLQVRYLIEHNISEIPKCLNCGIPLKHFERNDKFCCIKCAGNSEYVRNKVKETELKKYGGHHMNTNHSKDMMKKTNLEKYGVENYTQTDEYKDKIKNVWKNKTKEEIQSIVDKSKQTNIDRYGVINYSQTEECKQRVKETELERYGGHHMLTDKSKQAMKNSCLKKYGTESYSYTDECKEKVIFTKRHKFYDLNVEQLKNRHITVLSSEEEYYSNILVRYRCELCKTEFESNKTNSQKVICPECNKNKGVSSKEKDVLYYVQSIYSGNIIENDREILNGKELDIYIPDKHLAIEFDGNYLHSSQIKDKYYHQEKTLACKEQGIRLIHIFEYDWDFNKHIIQSIIKSSIGIYDKVIYARKCNVFEIKQETYKYFLKENHLQGSINSSIRYGLYYDDELIAVIGFGKSRFKKDEIELHRFCCKLNYHIPGAFSKLIKHSNMDNFITYVDLAHFTGDGYKKIGFKELSVTEPNYKWISGDGTIVLNRFQTQKHKLEKLLGESYNSDLTETENMEMNGYAKIYDSGNMKVSYGM